MNDRKNTYVIDKCAIIRIFAVLLLSMVLLFVVSDKVFAWGSGAVTKFYRNYSIIDYKINLTVNNPAKYPVPYTISYSYEVGDILCTAGLLQNMDEWSFLTQYPFADASFDLCFISNK